MYAPLKFFRISYCVVPRTGDPNYPDDFSSSCPSVLPDQAMALTEESRARPQRYRRGVLAQNNKIGLSTATNDLKAVNIESLEALE